MCATHCAVWSQILHPKCSVQRHKALNSRATPDPTIMCQGTSRASEKLSEVEGSESIELLLGRHGFDATPFSLSECRFQCATKSNLDECVWTGLITPLMMSKYASAGLTCAGIWYPNEEK